MPALSRKKGFRLTAVTLWTLTVAVAVVGAAIASPPNIVILFADDLGYGDLGCYGHPTIRTPHLDQMAAEGAKLTQFYAWCYCSPSRAALLTGRLPIRMGMNRVLGPKSTGGIPEAELTIAEALRDRGYATLCVGKWHLGHLAQYLPTRHGFDHYFGIPYSNDMDRANLGEPPIPLMHDEVVIEQPAVQETLTARYTEEAVRFIRKWASEEIAVKPFFLYLAYTFPHVPLHASAAFRGKSPRGLYGDVVEEIDASVGRILQTLRDSGQASSTLVVFTSDNGPWLTQGENGGSAGLFREGKSTTWEGGLRVPCLAWWPGTIPPGTVVQDLASVLDLFATCLDAANVPLPPDIVLDGGSLVPRLRATGPGPRHELSYYLDDQLTAFRQGPWKLHTKVRESLSSRGELRELASPLLFHLETDPSERFDLAAQRPEIVERLRQAIDAHRRHVTPGQPQH